MRKRRNFTPQREAQIALEVLSGAKSTAQACREHNLKEPPVGKEKSRLRTALLELAAQFPTYGSRRMVVKGGQDAATQYTERLHQVEGDLTDDGEGRVLNRTSATLSSPRLAIAPAYSPLTVKFHLPESLNYDRLIVTLGESHALRTWARLRPVFISGGSS